MQRELPARFEHAARESGIATLGGIARRIVGRELRQEEKVGGRDSVSQQLDSFANERRDGEDFFRLGSNPACVKNGAMQRAELVDRQGADMLGVEPDGLWIEGILFCEIHDGVGAVDAFQSEGPSELVEREELAIVLWATSRAGRRKLTKAAAESPHPDRLSR